VRFANTPASQCHVLIAPLQESRTVENRHTLYRGIQLTVGVGWVRLEQCASLSGLHPARLAQKPEMSGDPSAISQGFFQSRSRASRIKIPSSALG